MKIGYSCVVDGAPKFVRQGLTLVASLNAIGVEANRVTVNLTPSATKHAPLFEAMGVRLRETEFFGDQEYCNKIAGLGQVDPSLDMLVCCDSDLMFAESIEDIISQHPEQIQGKIIDIANPPLPCLRAIFDHFGWPEPGLVQVDLEPTNTFSGNFNGGLYVIPMPLVDSLYTNWAHCVEKLLDSSVILELLGPRRKHIDQIGFCAALNLMDHHPTHLPIELNFPTHVGVDEKRLKQLPLIRVFHYHGVVDENGMPVLSYPLQAVQERRFLECVHRLEARAVTGTRQTALS